MDYKAKTDESRMSPVEKWELFLDFGRLADDNPGLSARERGRLLRQLEVELWENEVTL